MHDATLPAEALEGARRLLAQSPPRRLLGLTGPPGAGKSTLAQALVDALGPVACLLPMDGFHLAHAELERLGRAQRKGAPDTFDALGFVALLERVRRAGADETVYAPTFRRDLEEPIAGAIAVSPEVRLVVAEGNYLLLPGAPWSRVRPLLDELWYVQVDDTLRVDRLVARHVRHGRSADDARSWVERSDEANARLVAQHRARCDRVIRLDGRP